jgi:hypothetical protein
MSTFLWVNISSPLFSRNAKVLATLLASEDALSSLFL